MEAGRPVVLTLAGRCYVLVRQILTGQKTIVWRALQLPEGLDPARFDARRLTSDHLEELRSERPEYAADVAPPETRSRQAQWVAIKIARPRWENDLREEARLLGRLARIGQAGRARVIGVVADLTGKTEPPVLILEWAPGISLNATPAFSERDGLRLALQLTEFVQSAFFHVILTDTLKPGSIFYDDANRSLVLLDLNTVGTRPEDMREVTLPILGQTVYRLFTGGLVEFPRETRGFDVSGTQIGPDRDAATWDRLSYGTRSLVTDLLLKHIPGARPDEIVANLVRRVSAQRERSVAEPTQLLASARQATDPAACLNDYDLAGQRDAELAESDGQRYRQALYNLLHGLPLAAHDTAWAILNWARRRFPEDVTLRWIWLVRQAAQKEPGLWESLQAVLTGADNPAQALEAVRPLVAPHRPALRAIQAEAQLRQALMACESDPTPEGVQVLQKEMGDLRNIWVGNEFAVAYGDAWLASLEKRIAVCQERATRVQDARAGVLQPLEEGTLPTAESLQTWQALQPTPALEQLHQVRRMFQENDVAAARKLLEEVPPSADPLIGRIQTALQRAIAQRITAARQAVEQALGGTSGSVIAGLQRWLAVQDNADLAGLIEAASALGKGDLHHSMAVLFAPGFPATADELVRKVCDALRAVTAAQVRRQSQAWTDQGNLQAARTLLEALERYGGADAEAKTIMWLLEQFAEVRRCVDDERPSEAYRLAYQATPRELANRDVPADVLTDLNRWARAIFDRLVGQALHGTSEARRNEAVEWLADPSKGIETVLAGAAAVLDEAVRLNPADATALLWLDAVRAFQRGRHALLSEPPQWEAAERNLAQAETSGWDRLAGLACPYAELARVGVRLERLERDVQAHASSAGRSSGQHPEPQILAHAIEAHIQDIQRCEALKTDLERLDRETWARWRDDAALERVQRVQDALQRMHNDSKAGRRQQRQHVWAAVYDEVAQGGSIADALRRVQNYCALDALSEPLTPTPEPPVPEGAFPALLAAPEYPEDTARDEWASSLADVPLQTALDWSCTWDSVAELIRRGKSADALAVAKLVRPPRPAAAEPEPVQDAIVERGRRYGQALYEQWHEKERRTVLARPVAEPPGELEALDRRHAGPGARFDLQAEARQAFKALNKRKAESFADPFARAPAGQWYALNVEINRLRKRQQGMQWAGLAIAGAVLLIVLVAGGVYLAPRVREWVQPGPATTAAPPAATLPPPVGRLTVGEPELQQGGAETWRRIRIANTGQVSGTFVLSVQPAGAPVQWLDATGKTASPAQAVLQPGQATTFTLVLRRQPPRFEPEAPVTLTLKAEGQAQPLDEEPVKPSPERLQIAFSPPPPEWVQGKDIVVSGSFTPTLSGPFLAACYDAQHALQGKPAAATAVAGQSITFTCPLTAGAAGEWHVAVFPQRDGWQLPQTRPDGVSTEAPFNVREPRYGIGLSERVLDFDPGPIPSVGVLYTLWNTGEVKSAFTVGISGPVTNVQAITLSISVVTGITPTSKLIGTPIPLSPDTAALTPTSELTGTRVTLTPDGDSVALFPPGFELEPCPDPQSGTCQIVRLAIAIYNDAPVSKGKPARLTLEFRPHAGQGEPVPLPVEVVQAVATSVPTWLWFPVP